MYIKNIQRTLFVTAPKWKQTKCTSTLEWINTLYYIHKIQCYPVMRGNKLNTMGVERKKPDTKDHILYDSIYVKTKTGKLLYCRVVKTVISFGGVVSDNEEIKGEDRVL